MHITAQCAHHILEVKCTAVKILQLCSSLALTEQDPE